MQIDMHYYGTYVMARCAGFAQDPAQVVATSAQFVDDNGVLDKLDFRDGAGIRCRATAHHPAHLANLNKVDQRQVWVPFHFLPGNEGEGFFQRLVCRMNSLPAQQMMEHHVAEAEREYALELLGIGAHVYADTFSHYGFSGIGSDWNKIKQPTLEFGELGDEIREYILEKAASFWEKAIAEGAEQASGALGHASVATYPDRPFLVWRFLYEAPERESGWRDNQLSYLEYCESVSAYFRDFLEQRPDLLDSGAQRDFADIREAVAKVIATEGSKEKRVDAWKDAMGSGDFLSESEEIPPYLGNQWLVQKDMAVDEENSGMLLRSSAYKFYQGASHHRFYVLRQLLPEFGLLVA